MNALVCTGGGGWIFGHLIDGLQAGYARVRVRPPERIARAKSW